MLLKRPYQTLVLLEALENSGNIAQSHKMAKEMLTHLTSEQLVLARFIDENFAQLVKQTEASI